MHDIPVRADERTVYIERYPASTRANHWLVVILFTLAALSGLGLFHPALAWLVNLFGGGPWARILHPFLGLAMALGFIGLAMHVAGENRMLDRDRQWLRQWRDVVANREGDLPEAGKYNAGQKLVFWSMLVLLVLLLVTGFLFWRPWFTPYVPITVVRLATLIHSASAALLVILVIVHAYAAIWVKGSVRAMVQGYVSARWARIHHSLWYREVTRDRP